MKTLMIIVTAACIAHAQAAEFSIQEVIVGFQPASAVTTYISVEIQGGVYTEDGKKFSKAFDPVLSIKFAPGNLTISHPVRVHRAGDPLDRVLSKVGPGVWYLGDPGDADAKEHVVVLSDLEADQVNTAVVAARKKVGLLESGWNAFAMTWIESTKKAEQAGTGQPATGPESKSEGSDKPEPDSEGRSR